LYRQKKQLRAIGRAKNRSCRPIVPQNIEMTRDLVANPCAGWRLI
jgi:hypothetical protein